MEIDKFCDRELQEMKELCLRLVMNTLREDQEFKEIATIALVEINRELDIRQSK